MSAATIDVEARRVELREAVRRAQREAMRDTAALLFDLWQRGKVRREETGMLSHFKKPTYRYHAMPKGGAS